MTEPLNLNDLKALIRFAKEQGIPKLKAGDFECELPAKDLNEKTIEALQKRIASLESITQRLTMQIEANFQNRHMPAKPFSARVELHKRPAD